MSSKNLNSFKTKTVTKVAGKPYTLFSLKKLPGQSAISKLPYSIRILVENLLRNEDGVSVTQNDIKNLLSWSPTQKPDREINFTPTRVILQDFTGVPAIVDLAAMRDAMVKMGGDPSKINPLIPCELVIDHSVQVDASGSASAFKINAELEFSRNKERYEFLRWGQKAFNNFKVVPPDTGIVHQVNLEYLARVVMQVPQADGTTVLCPDTLVGTDSHTTMINGLGVLGWGVGGIEAEAGMLGQPSTMVIPEVVGFKLKGKLPQGATATDAVLTVTQMLRKKGVVGKFVEFFGPGAANLTLADRATIANMAPEYGATCGFFPVDKETLNYLKLTGRDKKQIKVVEAYLKAQGLFWTKASKDPAYSDTLELDLATVVPCLAGPSRPQDRVELKDIPESFTGNIGSLRPKDYKGPSIDQSPITIKKTSYVPKDGDIVIAAITSCTNTSNPSVLIAAGLLAKKAVAKGLKAKGWVKTSLAPGSLVVTDYLKKAGLLSSLEKLGFHVVGYGCTTCIGNSGPLLSEEQSQVIRSRQLVAASVLSGNRNFEGRVHPDVRANYLASPPLVVAYSLTGRIDVNLTKDSLGKGKGGKDVYLKDIWPTQKEINSVLKKVITAKMYGKRYSDVYAGDKRWKSIKVAESQTYNWNEKSTYVQHPPYFQNMPKTPGALKDIINARVLSVFADSITTDHISPAGNIKKDSPAGKYLLENGVAQQDFNSYGARRGNHQVMMRGTFANIRIKNQMLQGVEGGMTKHLPDGEVMSIYDAAMKYQSEGVPTVVFAGKEYGSGSSRDWAAKGPYLQGIKAVIAESYERIHRSNLIGMGIIPLQFEAGQNRQTLGLTGDEVVTIEGIANDLRPGKKMTVKAGDKTFTALCRIDTPVELEYIRHGGILHYVLRQLV